MSFNGLNDELSTSSVPETGLESSVNTTDGSSLISVFSESYTTLGAPLEADFQRAPHRAWEEGYQSPFSQSYPPEQPSTQSRGAQPFGLSPENVSSRQHSIGGPPRERQTYQSRMRRVVTQEATLEDHDISALVRLGLSPFLTGQDIIANQNRFVRNECSFARHLVRLQCATADADARHSRTERDIYEHLEQQRVALNKPGGPSHTGTHSLRTEPDFIALKKAHEETRSRLEELSVQVAKSTDSIQRALMDLAQRLDQIISESRTAT